MAGEFAAALDGGSKTDQKQAEVLRAAHGLQGTEQVEEYLSIFLTVDKDFRKSIVTQKHRAGSVRRLRLLSNNEAARLASLLEKRRAVATADRSRALVHIASAVAERTIGREKQERGLLDYDDLIDKTLAMLQRTASGWVHYKLDQGVDHVLVDEAQDTSPHQWEIVSHIAEDFASGAGARGGVTRTIFAVGDEKQSIFSFQGAAPREFDRWHRDFRRRFEKARARLGRATSGSTFRSARAVTILECGRSGLPEADDLSEHSHGIGTAGRCTRRWPMLRLASSISGTWRTPDERPDIEGWSAPFDAVSRDQRGSKALGAHHPCDQGR